MGSGGRSTRDAWGVGAGAGAVKREGLSTMDHTSSGVSVKTQEDEERRRGRNAFPQLGLGGRIERYL